MSDTSGSTILHPDVRGALRSLDTGLSIAPKAMGYSVKLSMIAIMGTDADNIGAVVMQEMADREGLPLIVEGETRLHHGKVFHPQNHTLSLLVA